MLYNYKFLNVNKKYIIHMHIVSTYYSPLVLFINFCKIYTTIQRCMHKWKLTYLRIISLTNFNAQFFIH